jgi:hypothetical protein
MGPVFLLLGLLASSASSASSDTQAATLLSTTTSDTIARYSDLGGAPYEVAFDGRSVTAGGKRVLLLSGSVHYPRSTPEMWPEIFAKMKASGLNAVESYVFWNYHVPDLDSRAAPDYSGRGNVTLFLQLAAQADLFVIWRIGPYICAEWPGGGMPSWLRQVPGLNCTRCAGTPAAAAYMNETYNWMHQHIELVRPHFAASGGPIIMTQMENELSGPSTTPYVQWLGELATELQTGLPWIMCHGAHANDTIETCNGCDCTSFVDGLVAQNQPAMWTEDEQWFDRFSQGQSVRPTGDLGRGVAAFVAAGGSMHNFYMFHGGTMWGNWSTTVRRTRLTPSYANSANLASDSIAYDPKFTTIGALHRVLARYAPTILHTPVPIGAFDGGSKPTDPQWAVTHNGTASDPPLTFVFNDAPNATRVTLGPPGAAPREMAGRSAMIFDGASGALLWNSQPDTPDSVGQPYLPALAAPLAWQSWNDSAKGTWHRATFQRPAGLPEGAQVSVNMTGFGQGNLFLNGVHVAYFNLQFGECFHAPGGVNAHGSCDTYIWERCDRPTQDCYHVPPSWLSDGANEMLVWSNPKLPPNVTAIDPSLASVVYRVDPPALRRQIRSVKLAHGLV